MTVGRTVTELAVFSREDLKTLAKSAAKLQIIGSFYRGNIGTQAAREGSDGSIEVVTIHTPEAAQ